MTQTLEDARMEKKRNRLLALLLAVVFMFTLVPQVFAAGGDIKTWVYVHGTNGSSSDNNNDNAYSAAVWAALGNHKSKITVKAPGGTTILPDGTGKYEVPVGSSLNLVIAFHLDNRQEPNQNYEEGAYFEYVLPGGLNFQDTGNNQIVDKDNNPFANWTIVGNTLKVTLTRELVQVSDIWGEVEIDGTFTWEDSGSGDPNQTMIILGEDEFTFSRLMPDEPSEAVNKSHLGKSVVPDISNGKLKWTIQIVPDAGANGIDYRGHTLVDILKGPHSYINDTFAIKDASDTAISGGSVSYIAGTKELTYTFPTEAQAQNAIEGPLTITYETEILWNGLKKTSATTFKNGALLKDEKGFTTKEVFAEYQMSMFFDKTLGNR